MESTYRSSDELKDVDTRDVSAVLLALEKAARLPNFRRVNLHNVFQVENWEAFQSIYGSDKDPFADTCNNSDGQVVDAVWVERLETSAHEISDAVKMLETLLKFASQLQEKFEFSRERIIAAKRSKGIKSMPDELLAKIFQFAVVDMEWEGGVQAKSISQVSRRFRNITLGMPSLWTTLYSRSPQSDVEMFVRRAGPDTEFQAFVHLNFKLQMRQFMDICRPFISRWKLLTLIHDEKCRKRFFLSDGDSGDGDLTLGELFEFLGDGPRLPLLEELITRAAGDITSGLNTLVDGTLPSDTRVWAPNLRILRCSYFIPFPSSPLTAISTLFVRQNFPILLSSHDSMLMKVLKLLLKLPNLSTFVLEAELIYGWSGYETFPVVHCPTIKSFSLHLPGIPLKKLQTKSSCIATLMDVLRMPSLEDYSVSIGISDYDEEDTDSKCAEWSKKLGYLSCALLPVHFANSTRMVSLDYHLWIDTYLPDEVPPASKTLNLPFDAIARISSVTISSFVRVLFSQRVGEGVQHGITGECRLRELKFTACEYMTSLDLQCTIDSLESYGVWSDVERVVVQDCADVTHEEAMSVIGERKLRYLGGYVDLE
ncbi:hypothetical protein SCHPADRAFT_1001038 [Schizopora paradoxa]|uniref:Uncharacterized protein n=1 Tax=Schizopora paradoxa TaxID=27342 RepID=A0A0H2RA75_9AGAM|nr:hypothetical protein SCHPADRAFT_1001038 [Schizopora paradoxa]